MIGSGLTRLLLENGYAVVHLSRKEDKSGEVEAYKWDYKTNEIDPEAFKGVDYIIHLAGANIGEKKWTRERKKELKDSRVKTAELLFDHVQSNSIEIKGFISASAIGYYGYDSGSVWKKEGSRFGDDFLATLTKEWEAAADNFAETGIRTVKFRTGLVLTTKGGLLEKVTKVVKTGLGAALGSGDQYMSWVHYQDVLRAYKRALEDESMEGIYNLVAPDPATNKEFTKEVAKVLNKPFFMPNVPGFMLKLIIGEMASAALGSSRVSSEKIRKQGFDFKYKNLDVALKNILGKYLKSQSQ